MHINIKNLLIASILTSLFMINGFAAKYQQESTGQFVDSSLITTKVKAKLVSDKIVKSLPITVKTYKNSVQLSGFVNSQAQKARAELLAYSVPDVVSVDNALIIKPH
ncbi:MAG: BON domain-containing protein [Gammaproteobacteria bacterium]